MHPSSNPLAKLRTSLLCLLGLFVVGMTGYVVIGGRSVFESFYLAVVILTTVGMKESEPALSTAEQAWTILLMIAGIGTVLYTTGNVVAFVIDGQIRSMFGRRHLMNKLNKLEDHYIVVGFGRMGRSLCATLHYKEIPFVLIERDADRLIEADEAGYLYLRGDGMDEQVLLRAGVDRAAGLATCLSKDSYNVFVTLTARGLNADMSIIARSEDARTEQKLMRAGADRAICPPVIGAGRVINLLLNPQVDELLELDGQWPDIEVTKLSTQRFPRVTGLTLEQVLAGEHEDLSIVAIVNADGTRRFRPDMGTRMQPGDEIVLVGPTGSVSRLVAGLQRAAA